MLTMNNHPRLLAGSKAVEEYLKKTPEASPEQVIGWLYLSTLSRRPAEEEVSEAMKYVNQVTDNKKAYTGVLWMLVNRSEYVFVR